MVSHVTAVSVRKYYVTYCTDDACEIRDEYFEYCSKCKGI